jgi:hypothetical protein
LAMGFTMGESCVAVNDGSRVARIPTHAMRLHEWGTQNFPILYMGWLPILKSHDRLLEESKAQRSDDRIHSEEGNDMQDANRIAQRGKGIMEDARDK